MPIELDSPTTARTPVLRRQTLGEVFIGTLIKTESRQIIKDGVPQTKDGTPTGKPRMELVVHLVAMPGTTMHAGIGETTAVPAPGEHVRAILKGGGYGEWIDADNALKPREVGDVVMMSSDYGVVYDASTYKPIGDRLTDQAAIDAVPRGRSVGIYGRLAIRRPAGSEQSWVLAAEEAYMAADRVQLPDQAPQGAPQAQAPQGAPQAQAPQTPPQSAAASQTATQAPQAAPQPAFPPAESDLVDPFADLTPGA